MTHRIVTRADFKPRRATVDQEAGDFFLLAARRFFFAGSDKDDNEVGDVGVADEMLAAIDDPVAAVQFGIAFHAAHVGTGTGFGHRQCVEFFTLDRREQVLFLLLGVAGLQNAGRTPEEYGEAIRGATEFAFQQSEVEIVQSATAEFVGNIGREITRFEALVANFMAEFQRHFAGTLNLGFVWVDFVFNKFATVSTIISCSKLSPKVHCYLQTTTIKLRGLFVLKNCFSQCTQGDASRKTSNPRRLILKD